jgi:hypothetical protein
MLRIDGLEVRYGKAVVLSGLNLWYREGRLSPWSARTAPASRRC